MEQKHKRLKWFTGIVLIVAYAVFIEMVRQSGSPLSTVPTWLITRTLGIAAYLLLFFGICLGILYGMPIWKGKQQMRSRMMSLHFFANTSGVFIGALHPMLLILDSMFLLHGHSCSSRLLPRMNLFYTGSARLHSMDCYLFS
ncbi:hypothetical protein J9303_06535 [Bacillaceae bacterium Marseille-Q3522]|nr:hypothetical protein [Bacillaceae bacterium Marseille-Q3522]